MIASTADAALFITTTPAWEFGVDVTQTMETSVFKSRAGLEERKQRRQRCAWSIQWVAALDSAATKARDAIAAAEQNAAFIVPFWTERALTTTAIVANVVTIDRAPNADWFVPGDYVLITDGATTQFRLISSVAGSALTLNAGYAFDSGAKVYPCRKCFREGQATEWIPPGANATEPMKFSTL